MRALRYDLPFVEHQDQVGVDHRADALGDDKAGAVLHEPIQGGLDVRFGG